MRLPLLLSTMITLAVSVSAQTPAQWRLTQVAAFEGSVGDEIARVTDVMRLSDGRIAIANGKPLDLRIYMPDGSLQHKVGGKGDGPGEYKGPLFMLPADGDTLLVYDLAANRMSAYSSQGRVLKTWAPSSNGSPRGQTLMYHRALGVMMPERLNHCFRELANRLPEVAPPAMRVIIPDEGGRFWVHLDSSLVWTAYTSPAVPMGMIRLPAGFSAHDFRGGFVTGIAITDDGVEQAQVMRIGLPPHTVNLGGCAGVSDSFPNATSPRATELRKGLRQVAVSAEMAYSNLARYPSTADSMPNLRERLPEGTAVRIYNASPSGYRAAIFDKRSTLMCILTVNTGALAGWPDGTMRCGE